MGFHHVYCNQVVNLSKAKALDTREMFLTKADSKINVKLLSH
jgi:hypothetical protein